MPLKELDGSGKIRFAPDGVSGTRIFQVPWVNTSTADSYLDVVSALVGDVTADPTTGRPVLTTPDRFSVELPFLICREVDVEPVNKRGFDAHGRAVYEWANLNCTYRQIEVSESLQISAAVYSLPASSYKWNDSNEFSSVATTDGLTDSVGFRVPQAEYVLERRYVLAPDLEFLLYMVGKINLYNFLGFPPLTLRLDGIEAQSTYLPNGVRVWNMTFQFSHDPYTHIRAFRPDKGAWWYFQGDLEGGNTLFAEGAVMVRGVSDSVEVADVTGFEIGQAVLIDLYDPDEVAQGEEEVGPAEIAFITGISSNVLQFRGPVLNDHLENASVKAWKYLYQPDDFFLLLIYG